jgi:hypothetical protein
MLKFRHITILFSIALLGFIIIYFLKINYNYKQGYIKGKIDMVLEITNEIGLSVNKNTINNKDYKLFMNIKDLSLYIYEINGTKTIVIYN